MCANLKSLNNQLRKKGLEMVEEYIDPQFGPVYTFNALKSGISNNDVAYRLYYAGEVTKWSASRRKAIEKASRIKAEMERSQSESTRSSPSTS